LRNRLFERNIRHAVFMHWNSLYCFVRRPTYVHQPDAMLIVPNLGVYAYLSADLAVESPASAGLSPT